MIYAEGSLDSDTGIYRCRIEQDDDYWHRMYAGMALQGFLASDLKGECDKEWIIRHSISHADAMLKAYKDRDGNSGPMDQR